MKEGGEKKEMKIKIEDIVEYPYNYNTQDLETYKGMKDNLEKRGMDEEIELRALPNSKYELIKGHHRVHALKELGHTFLEEKDFILHNIDELELMKKLHASNIRGYKHPLKYPMFLKRYQELTGCNRKELAKEFHMDLTRLSRVLNVLDIKNEQVRMQVEAWFTNELIPDNELTLTHLEYLVRFNDDLDIQKELWDYIWYKRPSSSRFKEECDKRINNALMMKAYLEINDVSKEIKDYWLKRRYEKNSFKKMVKELDTRNFGIIGKLYYLPMEQYTEEEAKKITEEHHGDYLGIEIKSWYVVYIGQTIEEIREGKEAIEGNFEYNYIPILEPIRYERDFSEEQIENMTFCNNCKRFIKEGKCESYIICPKCYLKRHLTSKKEMLDDVVKRMWKKRMKKKK